MVSIEALANRIIREAVEEEATDIHIIPKKKESLLQFRISNKLQFKWMLPSKECDKLISHFKFTASMDIGERRRPQNGSYSTSIKGQHIGLRLSTLPSIPHESLVIRILQDKNEIPIHHISLFPDASRKLIALLKHAHGLVIFTGPTG
ncbi:ATPase, T2SS/T4P/T4SS family [Niallia sp. 03133]|uniref:ATPase, T2SS/T4P/T4SS family n=1 Tax=Niallia sp. 03133 TaxID=3458060 RepID=UPI004043E9D3